MAYFDVMVIPVKTAGLDDYKKIVRAMGKVWLKHGALSYQELLADDVQPGKVTSFPQSVKLQDDETVVVAFLCFATKAARNKAWKGFMSDPVMAKQDRSKFPADMKRIFFGGFKTLVAVKKES